MSASWFLRFSSALLHQGLAVLVLVLLLRRPDFLGWGDAYTFMSLTVPLASGLAMGGPAVLAFAGRLTGGRKKLGLFCRPSQTCG